ncbi:DNA alkylation repair protein [Inediibacterium massiliense]|uniref:DNA alkylation repair protein n=1 Tax=Inediibacterium massiliense TaxID=1658111 RepID=UPI0006B49969|nr:DNA alkylation repair protein [Inediibacterium massiliense]
MTKNEIITYLNKISSNKFKNNVVKMGIPKENSIGVSTADIRKLAKKLGISQTLSNELWETGYHEAKLLSVLIADIDMINFTYIDRIMKDVVSWDLCDHICKNLIINIPNYEQLIFQWCDDSRLYYKRASYCLIATTVIHNKNLATEEIDRYLDLIKSYAEDGRSHVKKAISWALREIGKRDSLCHDKAIILAYEFCESSSKNVVWIGKNALKELETLVSVKERGRFIISNSKMGKQK